MYLADRRAYPLPDTGPSNSFIAEYKPVKIGKYRYPNVENSALEAMVSEKMNQWIVKASQRPFTSLKVSQGKR